MLKLNKISQYFPKVKDPRRYQLNIDNEFLNIEEKWKFGEA